MASSEERREEALGDRPDDPWRSTVMVTPARRRLCTVFVLGWCLVLFVDTSPWGAAWWDRVKLPLNTLLHHVGLWQGQWGMFAPGPSVNNWWLSAEMHTDGGVEAWQSPFWMEVSAVEKFRRYRYMNYYNRIQLPQYHRAAADFARFLLRHRMLDAYRYERRTILAKRVDLFTNGLDLAPPPGSHLPAPEEIVWVSFSRRIAEVP
ncbi:MAG: hypothetical protein KatS3mg111_4153 [Pirellulaceae bacterium]|nr:MAG: hypothetical protein KatS3mg111_4153 [Pirellulaceae bacterium]